ncbi:hypothetical protein [Lacticaseibacillus thailandensis]|nr:hypothetical protein [Lacticaseibacillus thailandensis]
MINEDYITQINLIKRAYEDHFGAPFPERIIGWWDPLHIEQHPDELEQGVKDMTRDVNEAIDSNTPIPELTAEEWSKIIP